MNSSNLHFTLATILLTLCSVPSLSLALPTTPAEESSTAHTTENPADTLERLCGQKPLVTGDIALTTRMKAAAVEVLEALARKNPNERIQQCVISIPVDVNVDETIQTFNDGRHWEQKYNTAFLLFGKGVKPQRKDPEKTCEWSAEKTTGDALPASWNDTFWIKNTINLESGQKLIGIPLNNSDSQLADGYYVNVQRRLSATGSCSRGSASFAVHKDSLITLKGAGNTITGLTNIEHFNQIKTFTKSCSYYRTRTYRKNLNAQSIHFEVIKARFNPMALPVEDNTSILDIFNNQFFQFEKPIVDIAIKMNEGESGQGEIVSDRLADNTLVGIHNNRFYSCQVSGVEKQMAPAVKVNVDFHDASAAPKTVHALSVQENHFLTDGNVPVSFKLASNSKATIHNNQLNATSSGSSLYGMVLTGITDTNRAALFATTAYFSLANNRINNYQVSLLLNPKLALYLESNQLLGTSSPIELGRLQTFPVELSGDSHNEYLKAVDFSCGNLSQGSIQGGVLFSDGTACPSNWTPSLKTTPALKTTSTQADSTALMDPVTSKPLSQPVTEYPPINGTTGLLTLQTATDTPTEKSYVWFSGIGTTNKSIESYAKHGHWVPASVPVTSNFTREESYTGKQSDSDKKNTVGISTGLTVGLVFAAATIGLYLWRKHRHSRINYENIDIPMEDI